MVITDIEPGMIAVVKLARDFQFIRVSSLGDGVFYGAAWDFSKGRFPGANKKFHLRDVLDLIPEASDAPVIDAMMKEFRARREAAELQAQLYFEARVLAMIADLQE